jgi:hypothetical protein
MRNMNDRCGYLRLTCQEQLNLKHVQAQVMHLTGQPHS